MFSRGRPSLKRCGLSAVFDHVTAVPEEPLLFLYPRWFTSILQQQRGPISTVSRTIPHRNPSGFLARPRATPRKQSFGASSRRWISGRPTIVDTDTRELDEPAHQEGSSTPTTGNNGPPGQTEEGTVEVESPASSASIIPFVRSRHDTDEPNGSGSKPQSTITPRRHRIVMGKERMAIKQLSLRDRRKLRNRMYRTYRMRNAVGGLVKSPRWGQGAREMLEALQRETAQEESRVEQNAADGEEPTRKEILVPEETVALLSGISKWTMEENIWYVPVRNGCKVHVLAPVESEGQNRKVILTGTNWAIELVAERIQQAHELQERGDPLVEIRKPMVPVFPSLLALKRKNIPAPLVRGVWDFYTSHNAAPTDQILQVTKQPTTVREFTEYVEQLSKSLAPKGQEAQRVPNHQKRVARALLALFMDEKSRPLLSTAALNHALSFLLDAGFLRYSYWLVVRAENVATTDTFNLFLKAAAMKQDIRSFRRTLGMMSRMRIRPNVYTWLAYLDCLISPRAKEVLMRHMEHRGYLREHHVMRSALQLTVHDTFRAHLKKGGTVDEFFNKLARSAGMNWFSPSLLGQMFTAITQLKRTSAMGRLLEICKQHGLALTSPDGTVLRHITQLFRKDIYSLLHYMFLYLGDPNPKLTKEEYERLFLIAFKGHHYNICRVLWCYACMSGSVTYFMKDAVIHSLIQNVPREDTSESDNKWRTTAGKVIAGIDLHLTDYPAQDIMLKHIPPEFHAHPVSFLGTGVQVFGTERKKQIHAARAIVRRDIIIGTWYRPRFPLATMLEAAAMVDEEWEGVPRPVTWLMQNVIQIQMEQDYTRI